MSLFEKLKKSKKEVAESATSLIFLLPPPFLTTCQPSFSPRYPFALYAIPHLPRLSFSYSPPHIFCSPPLPFSSSPFLTSPFPSYVFFNFSFSLALITLFINLIIPKIHHAQNRGNSLGHLSSPFLPQCTNNPAR